MMIRGPLAKISANLVRLVLDMPVSTTTKGSPEMVGVTVRN
jgi:hypothetical protein